MESDKVELMAVTLMPLNRIKSINSDGKHFPFLMPVAIFRDSKVG
jgi:hypothetical protein